MYLSLPLTPIQLKEIIILFSNNSNSRFTKYTTKIPLDSSIDVLRKEFKKILNSKEYEEFLFSDMNTHRIHSIMNDNQNISEIKSKEKILCFTKIEKKIIINICQKKKNDLCG